MFTSHCHWHYLACNMFVIDWSLLGNIYQPIRYIIKFIRLFRIPEIPTSILTAGVFGKISFWPLLVPCAWARTSLCGLVLWTRSTFEKHWLKTSPANISMALADKFPARPSVNLEPNKCSAWRTFSPISPPRPHEDFFQKHWHFHVLKVFEEYMNGF
jgi:hypothetical protein